MKLKLYIPKFERKLRLPFADGGIRAGFPSPAQDSISESIDLNRELVPHPASTFYARAEGDSMEGCGIDSGDLLIIDKSIEPEDGDIVVAFIDGDFTLKKVRMDKPHGCLWLVPSNPAYSPIKVTEDDDFLIWGVLTYNIKKQLPRL